MIKKRLVAKTSWIVTTVCVVCLCTALPRSVDADTVTGNGYTLQQNITPLQGTFSGNGYTTQQSGQPIGGQFVSGNGYQMSVLQRGTASPTPTPTPTSSSGGGGGGASPTPSPEPAPVPEITPTSTPSEPPALPPPQEPPSPFVSGVGSIAYDNNAGVESVNAWSPFQSIISSVSATTSAGSCTGGFFEGTPFASVCDIQGLLRTPAVRTVMHIVDVVGAVGATAVGVLVASNAAFSLLDIPRILARFFSGFMVFGFARKRKYPWGTVYDSVTKEPLDPAYVELVDAVIDKNVAEAITDLDGRYGFLALRGMYYMRAHKTNYVFPSRRLAGRDHDVVYQDLYFGDTISSTEASAIRLNIPMDPVGVDWNQMEKRRRGMMHFVTRMDPYILRIFDTLFFIGCAFTCIEVVMVPSVFSIGIAVLYVLLLVWRVPNGRPPVYGIVTTAQDKPLAFGLIHFYSEGGHEIVKRVIDIYGRYIAIVPPGAYHVTIEKRAGEEDLIKVYETDVNAREGIINANFCVNNA